MTALRCPFSGRPSDDRSRACCAGPDPEQRDGGEPERHDRAERPADPRRPLGLDGKQRHEVTRQATDGMRSRGSGSQRTLCWRKKDSNPRSPARETTLRDCLLIEEVRFALDSPLEGDGFEPSVPRQKDLCKHPDRRRSAGVIGMLVNPKFADAETQSREALAAALTLGLQLHIVTGDS